MLPAFTPITSAIFSAVSAPPIAQEVTSAFPSAIAAARPSHPGNPQAPQFAPGRQFLTAKTLGSTSTAKTFEAIERTTPNRPPIIARMIIG